MEFTTGSQFLIIPERTSPQILGSVAVAPLSLVQELDYVSSTISDNQGRLLDLIGGTMLMGDGGKIVMNNGVNLGPGLQSNNNTFIQANIDNVAFHSGDFGSAATYAFDYTGSYGFNGGINVSGGANQSVFDYDPSHPGNTDFILVTPDVNDPTKINHIIITAPTLYRGITDVQPNTIIQEGDGTTGTPLGVTASNGLFGYGAGSGTLSAVGQDANGDPTPTILSSCGNSIIFTAVTNPLIAASSVSYLIADNGMICVDNTPNALAIAQAPSAAGKNVQKVLLMNELDDIVGTGGLEQSGALPLTLEGNTVYSGDTTIDPGRTIYLVKSPLGTGLASGLPNSIVHIGDSAVLDASQGDATQYIGGLTSSLTVNGITLDTYAPKDASGNYTPIAGALLPDANGDTHTNENATSGFVYLGQSTFNIGNALTNTPLDSISSSQDLAKYNAGINFNGIIAPGGDGVTQPLGQTNPKASTGGGLVKEGNFTQTLSGVNTYTGPTTIHGGVLAIASSGSIAASSGVYLQPETTTQNKTITTVVGRDFRGTNIPQATLINLASQVTAAEVDAAQAAPNKLAALNDLGSLGAALDENPGDGVQGVNQFSSTSQTTITTVLGSTGYTPTNPTPTLANYVPVDEFGQDTGATLTFVTSEATAAPITSTPTLQVQGQQTVQNLSFTGSGTLGLSLKRATILAGGSFPGGAAGDFLNVTGQMVLQSNAILSINDTAPANLTNTTATVVIAQYGALNGTFSNLPDGSQISVGNTPFTINYGTLAGYQNEITLSCGVPPPRATPTPTPVPTAPPTNPPTPIPTPRPTNPPTPVPTSPPTPTPVPTSSPTPTPHRHRRRPTPVPTPTPVPNSPRLFPTPTPDDDPEDWGL